MGQLIPFTHDGGTAGADPPLLLLAADRTDARFEVGSLRWVRELSARGIEPTDLQYDCTEASAGEISTAAACGVGRFVIDSMTELGSLPRRARVLMHVSATPKPVLRALLAGLHVEGVVVESSDLARAGEVCTRLALEGIHVPILQTPGPVSAGERRLIAAAYPAGPELWFAVGRLDDAPVTPAERDCDEGRRRGSG